MPSQLFTSSGVFTAPVGITSYTVECWGAGGQGAKQGIGFSGGGGGGAYAKSTITLTPGNSYTVTVGHGGDGGGVTGTNGTASTFIGDSQTVSADFGTKGGNPGAFGIGGLTANSTGTTKFSGGNGGAGDNASIDGGGGSSAGTARAGISSVDGSGVGGVAPTGGGNGGNQSVAGSAPGGGGGGSEGSAGAVGANGRVLISWGIPSNDSGYGLTGGPPLKGSPWFKIWPTAEVNYRSPPPMTGLPKTFYFLTDTAQLSTGFGALREGGVAPPSAQFAAWLATGTFSTYWKMRFGQTASPANATGTVQPDAAFTTLDCFRTQKTYNGTFRDDLWTVSCSVKSNFSYLVKGSSPGLYCLLRFRMFRSTDPNGVGAKEITSSYGQAFGVDPSGGPPPPVILAVTPLGIGAGSDAQTYLLSATYQPGAFQLANEYLFFETAIHEYSSGGAAIAPSGFTWIALTGSGITSPAFTDGLATPAGQGAVMPGVTQGPPMMGAPWFKPIVPLDNPKVGAQPINFATPGVMQAYPPPFTSGPLLIAPWGPTGPEKTTPQSSPPAPPATTRWYGPPFTIGPIMGAPWFNLAHITRDDSPIIQPVAQPILPALAALSLISRDPVDDPRMRRFMDQVSNILNSLIMQGVLTRKDLFNWQLNVAPVTTGRGPPGSFHDVGQGYQVGYFYIDSLAQNAYVNVQNNLSHAKWQNLSNGQIVGG